MSHGPKIPTLGTWAQQYMTEMMTTKSRAAFDSAFDAMMLVLVLALTLLAAFLVCSSTRLARYVSCVHESGAAADDL